MLTTTKTKRADAWKICQVTPLDIYIPSPLLLTLILENGWKIVGIELVPSEDQFGFVYLVTLNSDSRQQSQQLVLPRTRLIEKILDEQASSAIPVNESLPKEEWLLTI